MSNNIIYCYYDKAGNRSYPTGAYDLSQCNDEDCLQKIIRSCLLLFIHHTDYTQTPAKTLRDCIKTYIQPKTVILFISGEGLKDKEDKLRKEINIPFVFSYVIPHQSDVEATIGGYLRYVSQELKEKEPDVISPQAYYNNNNQCLAFEKLLQAALISAGMIPENLNNRLKKENFQISSEDMKSFWQPVSEIFYKNKGDLKKFFAGNQKKQELIKCAEALGRWWANRPEENPLADFILENKEIFEPYVKKWNHKT